MAIYLNFKHQLECIQRRWSGTVASPLLVCGNKSQGFFFKSPNLVRTPLSLLSVLSGTSLPSTLLACPLLLLFPVEYRQDSTPGPLEGAQLGTAAVQVVRFNPPGQSVWVFPSSSGGSGSGNLLTIATTASVCDQTWLPLQSAHSPGWNGAGAGRSRGIRRKGSGTPPVSRTVVVEGGGMGEEEKGGFLSAFCT